VPIRLWTLDLAREQAPTFDHLVEFARISLDAGYDGIGLYLEHRFAYPSAAWAAGEGALTPSMVRRLRSEFPSLQLVPFLNLLGHMEGFLRCVEGAAFAEEPARGMQGCPSNPAFARFCQGLLDDALTAFDSEIVHLGGDETEQLGRCPRCQGRSPASLYSGHLAPLIERTVAAGRRPALWGDMLLAHPEATSDLPKQTLVFDWQYFGGLRETSPKLQAAGFEVVGCPTLHVYDAAWMHLDESEQNVREVSRDARDLGLAGVCLTTWESGLFGAYDTLLPAVAWARSAMDDPDGAPPLVESYGDWGRLLGRDLNRIGGVFGFDGHRSRLKCRLLLFGDPFLAWRHHADQLVGPDGDAALDLCERALTAAPGEAEKGVALFVRGAVEFIRLADRAARHWEAGETEQAVAALAPTRYLFDTLETVATRTETRIGGSRADAARCRAAKEAVERVIRRIRAYGQGELGYRPTFQALTDPRFCPHDQACWWQVNAWGDRA
jgi:hypothetical protein